MKIIVKGNRTSYQLKRAVDNLTLSLEGVFEFNSNTPVRFLYDNIAYQIADHQVLFDFSKKLKGLPIEGLPDHLEIDGWEGRVKKQLVGKSLTELSLFKSLFLIYSWIELPLTSPQELNLQALIYDNFTIDYSGRPEPQKDIFFISKELIEPNYEKSIEVLTDLNLLASLTIILSDTNILKTYFIPLLTIGVSPKLFGSEKVYYLWNKILKDRDRRISYWFNNRL
jgi:hypothetical protein